MAKKSKGKSQFSADNNKIGVRNELNSINLINLGDNFSGESVDEHKKMESANEFIAGKEISQVNNNS